MKTHTKDHRHESICNATEAAARSFRRRSVKPKWIVVLACVDEGGFRGARTKLHGHCDGDAADRELMRDWCGAIYGLMGVRNEEDLKVATARITRISFPPTAIPPRETVAVKIAAPGDFKLGGFWIPNEIRDALWFRQASVTRPDVGLLFELSFVNDSDATVNLSGFIFSIEDVLFRAA